MGEHKITASLKEAIEYASFFEFVRESNRIEGIRRRPLDNEMIAHKQFVQLPVLTIDDVSRFVSAIQADAVLRDRPWLNVRVANHIAPPGGPNIVAGLEGLLGLTQSDHPFALHRKYETLHPFTDGNGRSGRAIWLWMMAQREELVHALNLGFLHLWYYQSLDDGR